MTSSIGTTAVEDVMMRVVLTVNKRDKMEAVAQFFETHDVNAAPVVDESGVCIGIITSHDLVEYESTRQQIENEFAHGKYHNLARYGSGPDLKWPIHFDEAEFNMNRSLETADNWFPLSRVAGLMCEKHIHHVLVVDDQRKPIGIISSLDILAHLTGSRVKRHPRGNPIQ